MFFDNMLVRQSTVRNLAPWSYALVLVAVPISLSASVTHLQCPSQLDLGVHVTITVSCVACSHTPLFSRLYWIKNGSHAEHQGSTWITYTPNGTRLSRQLHLGADFTLTQNLTCRLADGEHVQEKSIVLADFWC
ncbi:MC053L [Molluscum contagiosum virus subtype 1]|uniref:MC053L n=2 Tax=Molluscum contagiosum virus TaxID=10279 RepID=Q98221_MCV1|nr:MC053L [Molluscum contagiosum virus subtype 1]AZT86318.1 MC053L [Molluscum contagiosum virus]AAC55181.1 MC053L [Molluscum contagiosum virus subtype 1]QHW16794.1 MC053L [Molluscum contagiosum virus]QHW16976.1 MC053L [Molluscum contagiosum virus]QHW17158.1 MC053L [Molluscum contagiosum virus]